MRRMNLGFAVLSIFLASSERALPQAGSASRFEDPYTRGDDKLLAAAGYERVGSCELAPGQSSTQIEHALALENRIAWIETAHFKLGVELPTCKVDRDERKEVNEELDRLKKALPRVKAGASILDPWLRAHLVALRAEDCYEQFCEHFAIKADDKQESAPYLGMKSKFAVLIFTKESTLGTYAQTFLRREAKHALQHYLENDCLLYLDALEIHKADHRRDLGVRARIAYNVGVNLLDGYAGFQTMAPPWWREGYGQVLARQVSGKYAPIADPRVYENDQEQAWVWEPRVYGRARHNIAATAEKLFSIEKYEDLDFVTTMVAWSRVEFLLAQKDGAARKFLDALQAFSSPKLELAERHSKQEEALNNAFGFDAAGFDEQWRTHVMKTYDRR